MVFDKIYLKGRFAEDLDSRPSPRHFLMKFSEVKGGDEEKKGEEGKDGGGEGKKG